MAVHGIWHCTARAAVTAAAPHSNQRAQIAPLGHPPPLCAVAHAATRSLRDPTNDSPNPHAATDESEEKQQWPSSFESFACVIFLFFVSPLCFAVQ